MSIRGKKAGGRNKTQKLDCSLALFQWLTDLRTTEGARLGRKRTYSNNMLMRHLAAIGCPRIHDLIQAPDSGPPKKHFKFRFGYPEVHRRFEEIGAELAEEQARRITNQELILTLIGGLGTAGRGGDLGIQKILQRRDPPLLDDHMPHQAASQAAPQGEADVLTGTA